MARPTRWRACAHLPPLLAGLCLLAQPLCGQEFIRLGPLGSLNPPDSSDHRSPAVACSSGGPFVATWSAETFLSGHDIYARLYNFDGSPASAPILLTLSDGLHYDLPRVARADSGSFVVVWTNWGGSNGTDIAVYLQDAAGNPVAQFPANSHTAGEQSHPDVASDAAGNFVVVWRGLGPGDEWGTWYRLFDASGVPFGPEVALEASGNGAADDDPVVAMHRTLGTFVAAWEHLPGTGTDIHARRFDAAGAPAGPIFVASSSSGADYTSPAIAMDADGDFAILYEGEGQGDDFGILGQLYGAAGSPIGGEFWVNASIDGWHYQPRAAFEPSGSFVVAWTRLLASESSRAYATRFSASGIRSDRDDFPVTADFDPPRLQAVNSFCLDGDDTLRALLTERFGQFADDQIFSQRLEVSLFLNGFDAGDTASWSATLP